MGKKEIAYQSKYRNNQISILEAQKNKVLRTSVDIEKTCYPDPPLPHLTAIAEVVHIVSSGV